MAHPAEPRPVRAGQSLAALMEEAVPDPVLRAHYQVSVDGRPAPLARWDDIILEEGSLVTAWLVPAGGDDGRKFLRTVLQFAVMAAAIWVGGGAGGAIASKWLAAAAAATVTVVGNLAINALVPLPQPGLGESERFSPAYYPETARNEAALYQPVRVPFGQHRFFPALQGLPIQESVGEDVFLRYLLSLGPMPLKIDPASIKIGETPLSEFEGVDFELRLKPDDPPITLYTGDTFQLSVGALLSGPGSWATRTTQPDTTEIAVVLGFRSGLGAKDSKNRNLSVTVPVDIQYRPAGTSEPYRSVLATATQANTAVGELDTDRLDYAATFSTLEPFALAAAGLPGAQTGPVSITRREPLKPFRHVVRAFVPKGQYDVQVRRGTVPSDDERTADDVHWEFLDSVRAVDANPIAGHAVMALRIKGSDQLSGAIDTINMEVRREAPSLDPDLVSGETPDFSAIGPGDWDAVAETRNVADAALFALQGPMVARKEPDDGIHWPSLAALWKWSDINGFHFDFILDRAMRRDDMLQMICAAARARPVRIEGKYHFVIDAPRSGGPVQVFTGLNVRNFRVSRSWPQPVHALRIPFLNRENDYRQDERILYLPGYSADGAGETLEATLFERLELPGVTDPDTIWALGYFHAATALTQTERYSFDVPDAEGLTARLGDLVALQHDVLVTGLAAARVRSRTLDGSGDVIALTIDTDVTLEAGIDYGVVRRRLAGAGASAGSLHADPALPLAEVTVETEGETDQLVLAAPVDASIAPAVGDMVMIGETGKEYLEALIKGTRGLDQWGAGVEAVAYAPNRFAAGEGTIPGFDPKVTLPVDRRPSAPVFAGIEITDEGIAIAFDIVSGRTRQLARFEIGWRLHAEPGEEGPFEALPPLTGTARVALIPAGEPSERYDARIVAVDLDGRRSDPLLVADISASDALDAVEDATAQGVLSGAPGGARLPRLRVACAPIERDDVDVIHIEARPAGGLETDWRVRDWLAPAEPQKDIANVDPGELIDVAFRARTRRGVYSARVIVAAVQIPEEVSASSVGGLTRAQIEGDIADLEQGVADLVETYGSTASAAASAAAAEAFEEATQEALAEARKAARSLFPALFDAGDPDPYFTPGDAGGAPASVPDLATAPGYAHIAADPDLGPAWELGSGNTTTRHLKPKEVVRVVPGKVWEITATAKVTDDGALETGARIRPRANALNADYTLASSAFAATAQTRVVSDGVVTHTWRVGASDVDAALVDYKLPSGAVWARLGIAINDGTASNGKMAIGLLGVRDVTEVVKAEAQVLLAELEKAAAVAASGTAVTASESAGVSAAAALSDRNLTATLKDDTQSLANAVATDRSAVETAASDVASNAVAANNTRLSVEATTRRYNQPRRADNLNYWYHAANSSPDQTALASGAIVNTAGEGDVWARNLAASSGAAWYPKASGGNFVSSRVIEVRARICCLNNTGGTKPVELGIVAYDASWTTTSGGVNNVVTANISGDSVWQTFTTRVTLPASSAVYWRPRVLTTNNGGSSTTFQLAWLEWNDVTSEKQSETFAANASISETSATGAATTATGASAAAGTARDIAVEARDEGVAALAGTITNAALVTAKVDEAGAFSVAAQQASRTAAGRTYRYDASLGAQFFTGNLTTLVDPPAMTAWTFKTVAVGQVVAWSPNGSNTRIGPRDAVRLRSGTTYEVVFKCMYIGGSDFAGAAMNSLLRTMDHTGAFISNNSQAETFQGNGDLKTIRRRITAGSEVWMRPFLSINGSWGTKTGEVRVISIDIEEIGAQVLKFEEALLDENGEMAAYTDLVTAGSGYAGISVRARQSNGSFSSDIRYAAEKFSYGPTFTNVRMVMDPVEGERYCLNAAGTVRTVEENWDSGRFRLRSNDGQLTFDSANGGLQLNGMPIDLFSKTTRVDGSSFGQQTTTSNGIVLGAVENVTFNGGAVDVFVSARMAISGAADTGILECRIIIVANNGSGAVVYSKTVGLTSAFSGSRELDYRTLKFSIPAASVPTGSNYYIAAALQRTHTAGTITLAIQDHQFDFTEDRRKT